MRKTKKLLSLVLAVVMALSVFAVAGVGASAYTAAEAKAAVPDGGIKMEWVLTDVDGNVTSEVEPGEEFWITLYWNSPIELHQSMHNFIYDRRYFEFTGEYALSEYAALTHKNTAPVTTQTARYVTNNINITDTEIKTNYNSVLHNVQIKATGEGGAEWPAGRNEVASFKMRALADAPVGTVSHIGTIEAILQANGLGFYTIGSDGTANTNLMFTNAQFRAKYGWDLAWPEIRIASAAPVVNYDALNAAITAADYANKNAADYTSASWGAFDAAYTAAQAALAATTQEEVDAATAALVDATSKLALLGKCNYAALDAAIADVPAYDASFYTNWDAYATALAAANAVERDMTADEAGANQKKIDDAAAALVAAKAALTLKAADYAVVDTAKAAAEAKLAEGNWTSDSVAAVNEAIAAVVEGYDITKQAEVNAFAAAIDEAVANLTKLGKCNYAALDAAIADVPAYDASFYTNYDAYATALAAANAVERDMFADEAGANQKKIDDAAAALVAAKAALTLKAADYAAVDAAKAAAVAKLADDIYTADSVAAVNEAINAVVEGYDITKQAEVNAFADAINEAVANLVLRAADYKAVEDAIAAANAKVAGGRWTEDSIADVNEAINAVVYDLDITKQAEVQAMADAINAAADALVAVTDSSILSIEAVEDTMYPGMNNIAVVAKDNVWKVQFVGADGTTRTYVEGNTAVVSVTDNGDGTKTWIISMNLVEGVNALTAKARVGATWETDVRTGNVTVSAAPVEPVATAIVSAETTEITVGATFDLTVKVTDDATKAQIRYANGATRTYLLANAEVVESADGYTTYKIAGVPCATEAQTTFGVYVRSFTGWVADGVQVG